MKNFMAAAWMCLVAAVPLRAADAPDTAAISKLLLGVIVQKIPTPAVDTKDNWGHQADIITGYDVKRRGPLNWVATPQIEKKNDGHWTHLTVDLKEPAKTLSFELSKLTSPEEGKLTFSAALRASEVSLKVEQQQWNRGVRTFTNETRATCKAAVHMDCELTQRLETKPGATLPEMVLKLKVTKAELFYDKLEIEHTLGLGGDAAKLIGDATHKLLTRIKPSVERDLIAKANAAIVKAASEKEVRVSLESLLKK